MKNRLAAGIAWVGMICIAMNAAAWAAELAPSGPVRKLQRGFLNVALSPMEITDKIVESQPHDTALPTWMAGMVKGSVYAVTRCVVGIYEMVTAPLPLPRGYAPVMQPEFAWDYLPADKKKI